MFSNSDNRTEEAIQGALDLVEREQRKQGQLQESQRAKSWRPTCQGHDKGRETEVLSPKSHKGYLYHMLLP